ncbi:ankyrin repeat domain-containing protein [Aspergillus mulundensis]|uniref:Uncharacterized protein n=1 Tax=Aspergillus mulundensis TaxID=1810919 RepID=A0A3D8S4R2_9EURO|nr:hypothetical protein DSM5745_04839 [Aspergillus mulundensis]RDW81282.1 hypothetical protein DSM5745_04839 [Aspergillus mulundensis]
MSLLSLPSELILMVAQGLEFNRDINSLTRTTKLLYPLLNELLHRKNITYPRKKNELSWHVNLLSAESMQQFLKYGADVDQRDINGLTPLIIAARQGELEVAKVLLEQNADINTVATGVSDWAEGTPWMRFSGPPLVAAAGKGHYEMAKLLLDHGADVNHKQTKNFFTCALEAAIFYRRGKTARLLLDRGADVETSGRFPSPLVLASRVGDTKMVISLLIRGANIDFQHPKFGTALHIAVTQSGAGRIKTTKELLKRGANVNATRADGHTALSLVRSLPITAYSLTTRSLARTSSISRDVETLLLLFGADPSIKPKQSSRSVTVWDYIINT